MAADLAMAKVKEEQISFKELEGNLTKKQSLLEQQKLDYDEKIIKKEQLITKVSSIIIYNYHPLLLLLILFILKMSYLYKI